MTDQSILPISAILPCKNNRKDLEQHVNGMLEWVPFVSQVIVVDSSSDGSLDYLRERLSFHHVEFHSVPPGLYQAWNYGVSKAKYDFCYFSTVGDTISKEGLIYNYGLTSAYDLDIVLSIPAITDTHRNFITGDWPIHFLGCSLSQDVWFPNRTETIQWLTAFLPFTILGSSAANLYKTDILKRYQFPLDFGHRGDSAFGVIISSVAKICVTKRVFSKFVAHGQGRNISAKEQLDVAILFKVLLDNVFREIPQEWESVVALSRSLLNLRIELLNWLAALEPTSSVVNEQKQYIDLLEAQNETLRKEREFLSKLPVGIPIPFLQTGYILALKRFLDRFLSRFFNSK